MAVFSKRLLYNCYEIGHTWTPYCSVACTGVGLIAFKESLKVYASVYTLAALIRRKKMTKIEFLKFVRDIVQSSSFLAINGFGFVAFLCIIRHVLGYFSLISAVYIPAFIGSLMAILVERRSRRGILSLYVVNVATETLYRMLAARGIVPVIPCSEAILFSTSMALYMYLFRRNLCGNDYVNAIISFVLGKCEKSNTMQNTHYSQEASHISPYPQSKTSGTFHSLSHAKSPNNRSLWKRLYYSIRKTVDQALIALHRLPKHLLCPHRHSCSYYCLSGFSRAFVIGYGVHTLISLASIAPKGFKSLSSLVGALRSKNNLKFGLFLGCYAGIFKVIMCLLRWARNVDDPRHAVPAGFLAGLSSLISPSLTVSLHFLWKLIEIMYNLGANAGYLPRFHGAMLCMYATATAVLLHAAVMEPQNLRPAYWRYLNKVSRGKMSLLNHELLDAFGTRSSELFCDTHIKLDKRFVSDHFWTFYKENQVPPPLL